MTFERDLRNYRAPQRPDLEATLAQESAIAQELLEKAHARQLLEEVRGFWGVGEIVATPLSLTLAYRFPGPFPVSKMLFYNDYNTSETSGIDDRYLAGKYYSDENFGYAINIKPFAHRGFERFDPYNCLRVRSGPPIIFEPHFISGERIEGCDYDLSKLLEQGSQVGYDFPEIECIKPDEKAADRLREKMLAVVYSDNYPYGNSPLQREQAARSEFEQFNQQGKLYSSKEELLQAAREEQEATNALRTPQKRTGLARFLPH